MLNKVSKTFKLLVQFISSDKILRILFLEKDDKGQVWSLETYSYKKKKYFRNLTCFLQEKRLSRKSSSYIWRTLTHIWWNRFIFCWFRKQGSNTSIQTRRKSIENNISELILRCNTNSFSKNKLLWKVMAIFEVLGKSIGDHRLLTILY